MARARRRVDLALIVVATLAGCGVPPLPERDGGTTDAGRDAPSDSGLDAGGDAGMDGSMDEGVEGRVDGGMDAGPDEGVDGGADGSVDAGVDAGDSGAPDAAPSCVASACAWGACFGDVCDDPVRIAAGSNHTCVVRASGSFYCWGDNHNGAFGDSLVMSLSPHEVVSAPVDITEVTAGALHSCVRRAGGGVDCAGYDADGELGRGALGSTADVPFEPVAGTSTYTTVASRYEDSCAVTTVGGVECWGSNGSWIASTADTMPRPTPTAIPGIAAAVDVAVGLRCACAALTDGSVSCWGSNAGNCYGDGTSTERTPHGPVVVAGLVGAVAVTSGYYSQCALVTGGDAMCWGDIFGLVASTVAHGVREASGGGGFFCFLRTDGTVRCLGSDTNGQLGDGPTDSTGTSLVDVSGITSARVLAAGTSHACVIVADGNVWCWGSNAMGQIGDRTMTDANVPVRVTPP